MNKLYFREVTAQEQGIELYDKIIQNLNIDKDKLPKTLKGLTQIAKKLNIDITKITYETIKSDKNTNNTPAPNLNQTVQKKVNIHEKIILSGDN